MREPVNILLVDDQPGKLLSYEAILQQLGENLIKASSGREALEHLLKFDIPVVLMDVSMPELDGFALAEIIRQHPRFRKTAIIFVSAIHLSDVDRIKAYETGAVDYVSVPIVPELLRAKVSVFTELYRKTRDADRLNRELEERVAARTAELEEAVRQQTMLTALLRAADRRKDEFLALLAHELRNPLAPLVNAAAIMDRKKLADPDLQHCRAVIQRQATQLGRLVDDLLDVSRITLGKMKLRTARLDLRDAIGAAIEIGTPVIEEHRHMLEVSLPEQQLPIDGDMARLTQVVANLLNNAAKYQDDGGSIRVALARDGEMAVITVGDSGMGIPENMLQQVFELFTQCDQAEDRAAGGLGVGLSLVRTVVEMHGGTVTAHSAGPGRGSEFTVRLPCLATESLTASDPDLHGSTDVSQPRNILIVDDNRDAADGLALLFEIEGHRVRVARDSLTALELVEAERPDVLLLDIGLPGMDGYELCRRVRQLGLTDALIIAITGYGQERDRQRAEQAGFDAHVVKPVPFENILGLLSQAR